MNIAGDPNHEHCISVVFFAIVEANIKLEAIFERLLNSKIRFLTYLLISSQPGDALILANWRSIFAIYTFNTSCMDSQSEMNQSAQNFFLVEEICFESQTLTFPFSALASDIEETPGDRHSSSMELTPC